jgi:hypothetical protein
VLNDKRCARRGATSAVKRGEQPYDRPTLVKPLILETLKREPLRECVRPRALPLCINHFASPHHALAPR